jgi:hypothetical protein
LAHLLSVIKKDASSKPRLVEDLSFPHLGDSINSLTDVSDICLVWVGLAESIDIMVTAPEGTQAASLNIEHTYRTIGISPSEFWLGVIQDNYKKFLADLATKKLAANLASLTRSSCRGFLCHHHPDFR